MAEQVFAATMATPDDPDAFDEMAPENVAPLVVWLQGPRLGRDHPAEVFEVEAGKVSVMARLAPRPRDRQGRPLGPIEVGNAVLELLAEAPAPHARLRRRLNLLAGCADRR